MISNKMKYLLKTCLVFTCTLALSLTSIFTLADDSVEELQQETSDLQNQLSGLNAELASLSQETADLSEQIAKTDEAIRLTELNLAAAKLSRDSQYEAMKKRIKYMYENGNTSLLEFICSAENMSEFLNNTEFVSAITEYDKEMLESLEAVQVKVETEEAELKEKQAALEMMTLELEEKQNTLTARINAVEGDLSVSAQQLVDAKAAEAAAKEIVTVSNTVNTPVEKAPENSISQGAGKEASTSDVALLAAILECEAGSTNYDALLAVATVIMNRLESSRYPNTLSEVIYQPNQFSPARTGFLDKVLTRGPQPLCYTVAQDALNGIRLDSVRGCYSFRAAGGASGVIIGGNVFF